MIVSIIPRIQNISKISLSEICRFNGQSLLMDRSNIWPILCIRRFPLKRSQNLAQNRPSLHSWTERRSVDLNMVRRWCPSIETLTTHPLTQMTDNQHGPSFGLRSVGVTVGESYQSIRGEMLLVNFKWL